MRVSVLKAVSSKF